MDCSAVVAANPYISGLFALAGAVVALVGTHVSAWLIRRSRRRTFRAAMAAEAALCRSLAQSYVNDRVGSPLYRLPTVAYDNGFPELLKDGVVGANESKVTLEFYGLVGQINRGLDQAHDALTSLRRGGGQLGLGQELEEEAARLRSKAMHMVTVDGPYDRFQAVVGHFLYPQA